MKFELEFLEEFIKKNCTSFKKKSSHVIVPEFAEKLLLIEQEIERVKKCFLNQTFLVENESRIELYIQQHQSYVISLADKVAGFIHKKELVNTGIIS